MEEFRILTLLMGIIFSLSYLQSRNSGFARTRLGESIKF